jgi:dipeptidyl aminopeptidase/acylaminoacyl peptidase
MDFAMRSDRFGSQFGARLATGMRRHGRLAGVGTLLLTAAFVLSAPAAVAQPKGFTIEQALSAPFTSALRAAPSRGRLAWVANIGGRRNLWVAEPAANGKEYVSRQLTRYAQDDGQEINSPQWTPDAAKIVYVRGGDAEGERHPVPNPAWFPMGARQQLWIVSAEGGEPRLLADGHEPAISPDGKRLAYIFHGQVWLLAVDDNQAKPGQLLQMRGSVEGYRRLFPGSQFARLS